MIAQGLTLKDYPALVNDSVIGITFPHMDYINYMKIRIDELQEVKDIYKDALIDSWKKIEERDSLIINYVELQKYYKFEVNTLKVDKQMNQNIINNLNNIIADERRKNTRNIIIGSTVIGGLVTYIVITLIRR